MKNKDLTEVNLFWTSTEQIDFETYNKLAFQLYSSLAFILVNEIENTIKEVIHNG